MKRKKKRKGRHSSAFNIKRYFSVLGITLALIIAVALGGMALNMGQMNESDTEPVETAPIADGKINVLLMGVDQEGLRTDAIMLASYNTETNQVNMLSIPRDTRIYLGSRYQKINAAHAITGGTGKIAGAQGTIEAVTRLTGVPINYYVEFTFDSIADCMDQLGPVTFEIPDIEGDGKGMVYDDPVQDLHINLPAGVQELNGEEIVHLLRYRKGNYNAKTKTRAQYINGDIGRIAMQQDFLKALVDQKLNASLILKIPAIFKEISEGIKTNLTVTDVIKYSTYLTNFTSTGINAQSLPGQSSGDEYDASYWICDLEATRAIIENDFGYDASGITVDKPGTTSSSQSTEKKTASSTKKPTSTQSKSSSTTSKATSTPKTSSSKNSSSTTKTEAPKKATTTQTPKKSEGSSSSLQSSGNSVPKKTATPAKAPSNE